MLAGLAALALLGLLLAGSGKKGEAPSGGLDAAVAYDLQKLYAANPTTYAAVNAVLGGGNPAVLAQYALQLNALYPNLAKKLGDMAASEMTPVTGPSGTQWNTWGNHDPNTGISNVDVLQGAMPVMSFQQTGDNKATRKFLGAASGVDSKIIATARADFGV